jgi:hypothetical protein
VQRAAIDAMRGRHGLAFPEADGVARAPVLTLEKERVDALARRGLAVDQARVATERGRDACADREDA